MSTLPQSFPSFPLSKGYSEVSPADCTTSGGILLGAPAPRFPFGQVRHHHHKKHAARRPRYEEEVDDDRDEEKLAPAPEDDQRQSQVGAASVVGTCHSENPLGGHMEAPPFERVSFDSRCCKSHAETLCVPTTFW